MFLEEVLKNEYAKSNFKGVKEELNLTFEKPIKKLSLKISSKILNQLGIEFFIFVI